MIYINSYEPKRIIELLNQKTEVKVENFSPADYIVNDIAIERKTLSDFCNSLANGRLFEQLSELKYYYSNPVLLLENFDMSFINKTNVFYSILIKILFEMNIKIIFSHSIEHTAEILYLLDRKNGHSVFVYVYKNHKKKQNIDKIRENMLKIIYNIGNEKAKALLAEFKTIREMLNANEEKLLSIEGIGKGTVRKLKMI